MKGQQGNWEEILNEPINTTLLSSNPTNNGLCDAVGARITTTLLKTLSEEERRRIAEHVHTCSACSTHFREHQFIEEFAPKIAQYELSSQYQPRYKMYLLETRQPQELSQYKKGVNERSIKVLSSASIAAVCLLGLAVSLTKNVGILIIMISVSAIIVTALGISGRHNNHGRHK